MAEICRKAGIGQATYFNWNKKYAGMMSSEMRRMSELEQRIREICQTRVRYGYRRVQVMLRREG